MSRGWQGRVRAGGLFSTRSMLTLSLDIHRSTLLNDVGNSVITFTPVHKLAKQHFSHGNLAQETKQSPFTPHSEASSTLSIIQAATFTILTLQIIRKLASTVSVQKVCLCLNIAKKCVCLNANEICTEQLSHPPMHQNKICFGGFDFYILRGLKWRKDHYSWDDVRCVTNLMCLTATEKKE